MREDALRIVRSGVTLAAALLLLNAAPALSADEMASEEAGEESREEASEEASEPAEDGAAGSTAEGDAAGAAEGIEEITVTARRREESLQETPISITAFSQQALTDRNVRDLSELTFFTPNLRFTSSAAQSANSQIYIRGIGQAEGTINAEPRVGLYLDDVYQARPLGSILATFDMQRVEVLRGPQGTLYGKNAIGGAINVIRNRPGPEYEAMMEVEAGSFGYSAARLMGNMPVDLLGLGDKLFLRGTFVYEKREGYLYDQNLHTDFASHNLTGGSAALRLLPTDNLDIEVYYSQAHQPQKSKRGECELIAGQENSAFMQAVESPNGKATIGGSFIEACQASNELLISTNLPNKDQIDTKKIHGFMTWDLGPLAVKSITGYQSLEQNFNFDWDSTARTLIHSVIRDLGHSQFSQELRVDGEAWDDRVHWTTGGFYLQEQSWGPPTHTVLLAPDFKVTTNPYWPLDLTIVELSSFKHRTAAGYVFGEVEPIDRLHINGGFRYGWEEKWIRKSREIGLCVYWKDPVPDPQPCTDWKTVLVTDGNYDIFGALLIPTTTEGEDTSSWTAPTGNVSITYDITDTVHGYAGYQRGFSSGGFNYIGDDQDQTPQSFEPEDLHGVEIGLKTSWLDNRLTVNASYFYNFYQDMQVRIQEAGSSGTRGQFFGVQDVIRNAGDATIQGGELEIVAMPVDGLIFNGNLGLTFPQYQDFKILNADASRDATEIKNCGEVGCSLTPNAEILRIYDDISSNNFPNTPKVNFNLGLRYTWELGDDFELSPWVNYSWQSKVYFDVANTEELSQDNLGLLDGSLTLEILSSETTLTFWAKNITDETHRTGGYSLGSYVSRFYGMPRTFGGSITQRFGGS